MGKLKDILPEILLSNKEVRKSLEDFTTGKPKYRHRNYKRSKGINAKTLDMFKKLQDIAREMRGNTQHPTFPRLQINPTGGRRSRKEQSRMWRDYKAGKKGKAAAPGPKAYHMQGHALDVSFGGVSKDKTYHKRTLNKIRKQYNEENPTNPLRKKISGDEGHFILKDTGLDVEGGFEEIKARIKYDSWKQYYNKTNKE